MKKIILAFALLIGVASFNITSEAQVTARININTQPAWGPVGYDYVEYYYLPDINCYYDVVNNQYYYSDHGRWLVSRYLPNGYRDYDLYRLHKVVVNTRDPWTYNASHRRDYKRYVGSRKQIVIRDSRDRRYAKSRRNTHSWYSSNHRPSNNTVASRPHDNGRPSYNKPSNRPSDNKYDRPNRRPNNNRYER